MQLAPSCTVLAAPSGERLGPAVGAGGRFMASTFDIAVNASAPAFDHFWRSCGWCPPDPHPDFPTYFAREDVWQNHALIGSVPHRGIQYVRIHYLLDLVKRATNASVPSAVTSFSRGYLAGVALDWSALDAALDALQAQGLDPGFEIMGNPGNAPDRADRVFTSFKEHPQILGWRDLVAALGARYIGRFGAASVRRWRFESWNEPEGQCKRDLTVGIECDVDAFLSYWDACAAGLQQAAAAAGGGPSLLFGGTASDGDHHFLAALEYAQRESNSRSPEQETDTSHLAAGRTASTAPTRSTGRAAAAARDVIEPRVSASQHLIAACRYRYARLPERAPQGRRELAGHIGQGAERGARLGGARARHAARGRAIRQR